MEKIKRKSSSTFLLLILLCFAQRPLFAQSLSKTFEQNKYLLVSIDSCIYFENFNEKINVQFERNGLLKRLFGADGNLHFYSDENIKKDSKYWTSINITYELGKKDEIRLKWNELHKEQENFDMININILDWFYDISNSKGNLILTENGLTINLIYSFITDSAICVNLKLIENL